MYVPSIVSCVLCRYSDSEHTKRKKKEFIKQNISIKKPKHLFLLFAPLVRPKKKIFSYYKYFIRLNVLDVFCHNRT